MAVSYDVFTKAFLAKVTEYGFTSMKQFDRQDTVDTYMKVACSQFNRLCPYDLTNRDDKTREFLEDIPSDEVDEIADIISEGMLVQWMKPYYYRTENYENVLNNTDFNAYSVAELLYRITNAYQDVRRNFQVRMKAYSYDHGDLTDLSL